MTPLQLALVGAGVFGTRYLESLRRLPGVAVRWVCDLDGTKATAAKERQGGWI